MSDGNCLLHASLLGIWGLHDYGKVGGLCSLRAAMCKLIGECARPWSEPYCGLFPYNR